MRVFEGTDKQGKVCRLALRTDKLSISWHRAVVLLFCLAWFTSLAWWHRNVVMDDPWITFRYAQNVSEGYGWVFNSGEAIEGYSNFTWVWISAAAHYAGIEPLGFARVVSWLCVAAVFGVLVFGAGWRRGPPRTTGKDPFAGEGSYLPRSGTAALLLASCYPLAVWTMGGLETAFYTSLLFVYIAVLARAWANGGTTSGIAAGALGGLVAISRPEAPMFGALLVGALALGWRGRGRGALLNGLLVMTAIGGVYLFWRWHTYGTVVPNTVQAKVGGGPLDSLWRGMGYFFGWFGGAPIVLLGLSVLAFARAARRVMLPLFQSGYTERLVLLAGGAAGLQLVFAVAVGGDWMPAARFFVPLMPMLALMAAAQLRRWPFFVRWVLIGFFLVAGVIEAKRDGMLNWCRWAAKAQGDRLLVAPLIEAGQWLKENADADDEFAATEAGVMPYYSELRFIDMLGLVDEHIAGLPGGLHQKFDADYVMERQPEFIVLQYTLQDGGREPTWAPDRQISEHPDFPAEYTPVKEFDRPMSTEEWGMAEGRLVVYARAEENRRE